MKASELIERLEELIDDHGDLVVYIFDELGVEAINDATYEANDFGVSGDFITIF